MDHSQPPDSEDMTVDAAVGSVISADVRSKVASPALSTDLDRIEALTALKEDWDTYGGVPPTIPSARRAADLLVSLVDTGRFPSYNAARPYTIAPLASGGLHLEWRGPHGELTVEVYPDGLLGYYALETRDGVTTETDEEDPPLAVVHDHLRHILGCDHNN